MVASLVFQLAAMVVKIIIIRNAEIMDAENSSILIICKYSRFVCMRGE